MLYHPQWFSSNLCAFVCLTNMLGLLLLDVCYIWDVLCMELFLPGFPFFGCTVHISERSCLFTQAQGTPPCFKVLPVALPNCSINQLVCISCNEGQPRSAENCPSPYWSLMAECSKQ